MPKNYLTPNQVAELLMVSPVTVRQWAQKGWLKALTTAGGHRRFLYHDIENFAHERGLTLIKPDNGERRILIVDDNKQLANYLVELFTGLNEPLITETAYDGFDAGRKVQSFKPDIILLDLMMPGLDGFEVCHQLKEDPANKALRIIAMTGFHTPENVKRITSAGAEACFAKPIDEQSLLDTLGLSH